MIKECNVLKLTANALNYFQLKMIPKELPNLLPIGDKINLLLSFL